MKISYKIILLFLAAPSKPRNLNVTSASDTRAMLSWTPPLSDGGRGDVFYIVKYKTTMEQQFIYYSPSPRITSTSVALTSLVPFTAYMLAIVAENGVTQEFPDQFLESDRTSSVISTTTKEGGEYTK